MQLYSILATAPLNEKWNFHTGSIFNPGLKIANGIRLYFACLRESSRYLKRMQWMSC